MSLSKQRRDNVKRAREEAHVLSPTGLRRSKRVRLPREHGEVMPGVLFGHAAIEAQDAVDHQAAWMDKVVDLNDDFVAVIRHYRGEAEPEEAVLIALRSAMHSPDRPGGPICSGSEHGREFRSIFRVTGPLPSLDSVAEDFQEGAGSLE